MKQGVLEQNALPLKHNFPIFGAQISGDEMASPNACFAVQLEQLRSLKTSSKKLASPRPADVPDPIQIYPLIYHKTLYFSGSSKSFLSMFEETCAIEKLHGLTTILN